MDGGLGSATYTAPTAQGSHTVVVTDTDTAGNTANASITFNLDTTAPTIAIGTISGDDRLNLTEFDLGPDHQRHHHGR